MPKLIFRSYLKEAHSCHLSNACLSTSIWSKMKNLQASQIFYEIIFYTTTNTHIKIERSTDYKSGVTEWQLEFNENCIWCLPRPIFPWNKQKKSIYTAQNSMIILRTLVKSYSKSWKNLTFNIWHEKWKKLFMQIVYWIKSNGYYCMGVDILYNTFNTANYNAI